MPKCCLEQCSLNQIVCHVILYWKRQDVWFDGSAKSQKGPHSQAVYGSAKNSKDPHSEACVTIVSCDLVVVGKEEEKEAGEEEEEEKKEEEEEEEKKEAGEASNDPSLSSHSSPRPTSNNNKAHLKNKQWIETLKNQS